MCQHQIVQYKIVGIPYCWYTIYGILMDSLNFRFNSNLIADLKYVSSSSSDMYISLFELVTRFKIYVPKHSTKLKNSANFLCCGQPGTSGLLARSVHSTDIATGL